MADYNSSLPVIGSQHVTQSTVPWVISGTVSIDTDPLAISGIVNIGTDPVPVSGIVNQGTDPWIISGITSVNVLTDPVPISGIVNIGTDPVSISGIVNITAGSVIVTNTISTTAGARSNIVNDYTSGINIAAGGSIVHTYLATGSLYVSRIITGFSGKGKSIVAVSGTSMLHKVTGFNSTAFPNIQLDFGEENGIYVEGSGISVISFNREASNAQDVYSTIIGYEVL